MINGHRVAIVDYGMGNLFSVQRACERVGLSCTITSSPDDLSAADGVILPGVGGMPDAMRVLVSSGLREGILQAVSKGLPLFGICLGLQLIMSEGSEFEPHEGLGIIPGKVVRFPDQWQHGRALKVPHVGWTSIWRPPAKVSSDVSDPWAGTPLEGSANGVEMYFVHSYHVEPADVSTLAARTRYGDMQFCSAISSGAVFGCQFHPERSGAAGLRIYKQFAKLVGVKNRLRERGEQRA